MNAFLRQKGSTRRWHLTPDRVTWTCHGPMPRADEVTGAAVEVVEAAEYDRLRGECCPCEACGHVQAEPNWCHECGHRTTAPKWAEPLVDAYHDRRDLHEALSDIQYHSESAAGESWEDAYKEVVQIATDALEKAKEIK